MKLNLIVAHDKNNIIGNSKTNNMPWYLPPDLQNFKKITMGFPMIMGKNTFLSFKKPLPGRKHIVICSNPAEINLPVNVFDGDIANEQVLGFTDLTRAIIYCESWLKVEQAFIIGGGKMYETALKQLKIDKIYRTLISGEYEGDVKFPELKRFKLISSVQHQFEDLEFSFDELV